jgi:hypothetical protein
MKRGILGGFLVTMFAFLLGQLAWTQGADVPFREQDEQLQGRIHLVVPENNLLFVEKNSITYSFKTSNATRILVNNQASNLEALAARRGSAVTVRFRVKRDGNLDQEITSH